MISLISNQALRGGESLPEHIRTFFGGAMITITICAPLILFACYHGHKESLRRVDQLFDILERWMTRMAKPKKPVLPVTMPTTMKRSVSEPILRQFPTEHPLTRPRRVVVATPSSSPPHTPIYMSGELTFSYNSKTTPVKEEV